MRALLLMLVFALPAQAVTIETKLRNPAQEEHAQKAIEQLKCVVCEGQALADSDAKFAREMRAEIRRMAAEGKSSNDITGYFRERYGAQILLTPPVEKNTLLLWVGPLLFLLGGAAVVRSVTRRQA